MGAYRLLRKARYAVPDAAWGALLILFLVQYLAVTVPGILGILSPVTVGGFSLAAALVIWWFASRNRSPIHECSPASAVASGQFPFLVASAFILGFGAMVVFSQRGAPVIGNDAISYHFPIAARWLQDHQLSLVPIWFYNPANTYSPLAGSVFVAWWMGLTGNDLLARWVAFPALLLLAFAGYSLLRRLRCSPGVSALLMIALALCRPVVSQVTTGKDDVYLAALFCCALVATARRRSLWMTAISLGLMLACKTTALLVVPVFFLLLDRHRIKRSLAIAIGPLVLAGPWFFRTFVRTGNPLFPIDVLSMPGLFSTANAPQLRSVGGVIGVLFCGSYSLPPLPALLLIAGWMSACAWAIWHSRLRDPLVRAVLVGPALIVALFIAVAPFAEVRFVMPAFVLLFAGAGLGIRATFAAHRVQYLLGGTIALLCLITSFSWGNASSIVQFVGGGILFAVAAVGLTWAGAQARRLVGVAGGIGFVLFVYVQWQAYADAVVETAPLYYAPVYGQDSADAWTFIAAHLSPGDTLAYSNTFYIYPLMSPNQQRRIVYAPVRAGVRGMRDLPRFGDHLTGDRIGHAAFATPSMQPDAAVWIANLRRLAARHVIIFMPAQQPVPEIAFADARPDLFQPVFRNSAAVIYSMR